MTRPQRKHHHKRGKARRNPGQLPANTPAMSLTIASVGSRGDGVGRAEFTHQNNTAMRNIFVPDTAEGDVVKVQPKSISSAGVNAELIEVITPSPHRKQPSCIASPACGGCQFQHLHEPAYQDWKDNMVKASLGHVNPQEWRSSFTSPFQSRRRTRLAFRRLKDEVVIGFRGRSSHQIIDITGCLILAPELMAAREMAQITLLMELEQGHSGELDINLCDNGWDMTIRPDKPVSYQDITALISTASTTNITRLSVDEGGHDIALLYLNQKPQITWHLPEEATRKSITLNPAASTFLQAVPEAEAVMIKDIFDALCGHDHVLDLFCGSGTLSMPLLFQETSPKTLTAYDSGFDAIQALQAIANAAGLSQRVTAKPRNLVELPLDDDELKGFDAAIVDPPRSGAAKQMPALAKSNIPRIMMVSCNPSTFARDAAVLIEGGYSCKWARHIDQFLLTAHAEIVACFDKDTEANAAPVSMFD